MDNHRIHSDTISAIQFPNSWQTIIALLPIIILPIIEYLNILILVLIITLAVLIA